VLPIVHIHCVLKVALTDERSLQGKETVVPQLVNEEIALSLPRNTEHPKDERIDRQLSELNQP
jgi:hypothetical protein